MRKVSLAAIVAALGLASAVPVLASHASAANTAVITAHGRMTMPTPYASFLVGRFAMAMGDLKTASQALSVASAGDPVDGELREKAFLMTILDGDIDGAARLMTAPGKGTNTAQLMGGLIGATTAVKAGKGGAALKAIDSVLKIDSDERSSVMLRPYILAMNNQWNAAFDESGDAALNGSDRGRLLVYLIKAERARLYEMRGDKVNADALYQSLYQPGAASFIFGPDYAGFLERQGRKDEARAVWKSIADTSTDPVAQQALQRLDSSDYKPTPMPSLRVSMAQALLLSATIYSSDHDAEMALANLRLSLYLDDGSDRARIFLGQIEQELKDTPSAEAAWASVPLTSPYATEAALRRIWSLRGRGANDEALSLVEASLVHAPDDIGFTVEKADILHDESKDQAALTVLDERIARKGDKDFTWQAWFIQAIAYDAVDRWPEAEAAIKKAQALDGDRPEVLNFLGYGWIDHNLHVQEGMDLIRQAMNLSPRSGAIVDSLGWGYYRLGQYEQALGFIEQAVQMAPSDAEVNEHLGDVYLALGRDTEARYEWQRVLTLDATPKIVASVKAKLDAHDVVATGSLSKPVAARKAETTAFNDKAQAGVKAAQ